MAISMSDNKRDEHKFINTSPTPNNLEHAIYEGTDTCREIFRVEPTSMRKTIGDILFLDPYKKKHEFIVGHTGAYALPQGFFSGDQRVEQEMTEEHQSEYSFCIVEKLREYVTLIWKNRAAVPYGSYQYPEFTLEKATEIAEEVFKASFERTRGSYKVDFQQKL